MIEIYKLTVTPIQQNCRIIKTNVNNEVLIIDPGGDFPVIDKYIKDNKLIPTQIWLTHSHLDHCGGVKQLKDKYNCQLYGHPIEKEFRARVEESSLRFGIESGIMLNCPEPDFEISGDQILLFNGVEFKVLFTPGHSPGHLCFYLGDTGVLLAGDTLFAGSIGRTDLPMSSHQTLMNSIHQHLMTLPDETKVLSGHGPDTTIGKERRTNPFIVGY